MRKIKNRIEPMYRMSVGRYLQIYLRYSTHEEEEGKEDSI